MKLFSKTWINDYPWLKLAMKSMLKLSKDPVDWTVVGDKGSKQDLEAVIMQAVQETGRPMAFKVAEVQEYWPECDGIANGYLAQQWVKMNAHMIMGDCLFWNWDSDVIAIKPLGAEDFMGKSGRPVYWFSQFNSIMDGADRSAHLARISMMKEVLNMNEISFEWMRCMPIPMYGQILRNGSSRSEWQKSFEMLKRGDARFSEFNVIGQFSHLYSPDAYEWKNADIQATWSGGYVEGGEGSGAFQDHALVAQQWSWGGVPKHVSDFVNGL